MTNAKASVFYGAGDEARYIFAYGENQGVVPVQPETIKSPPDSCIEWFEPLLDN